MTGPAKHNGSPQYAAFHSGSHVELDPEVADRLKAQRDRNLHTSQIPLLRAIGFSFFALGVGLHNWLIVGDVSWPLVVRFAALLLAYSFVSWVLLRRFYGRTGRLHLGDFFLTTDIFGRASAQCPVSYDVLFKDDRNGCARHDVVWGG